MAFLAIFLILLAIVFGITIIYFAVHGIGEAFHQLKAGNVIGALVIILIISIILAILF